MRRRRAILDSTNVQDRLIKVSLLPTKIDKLRRAEPVPEGNQDHRRVTVAPPIALCRLDEALDLRRLQVLAGPQLSVRWAAGRTILYNYALFRFRADKFQARTRGPFAAMLASERTGARPPAEDKRRRPLSAAGGCGYWKRGGSPGVGDAEG